MSRAALSRGGVSPAARGVVAAPSVLRREELLAQSREDTEELQVLTKILTSLSPTEQPLSDSPAPACTSPLPALPAQRLDPAACWSCLQLFLDALPGQACAAWGRARAAAVPAPLAAPAQGSSRSQWPGARLAASPFPQGYFQLANTGVGARCDLCASLLMNVAHVRYLRRRAGPGWIPSVPGKRSFPRGVPGVSWHCRLLLWLSLPPAGHPLPAPCLPRAGVGLPDGCGCWSRGKAGPAAVSKQPRLSLTAEQSEGEAQVSPGTGHGCARPWRAAHGSPHPRAAGRRWPGMSGKGCAAGEGSHGALPCPESAAPCHRRPVRPRAPHPARRAVTQTAPAASGGRCRPAPAASWDQDSAGLRPDVPYLLVHLVPAGTGRRAGEDRSSGAGADAASATLVLSSYLFTVHPLQPRCRGHRDADPAA